MNNNSTSPIITALVALIVILGGVFGLTRPMSTRINQLEKIIDEHNNRMAILLTVEN
jgi:hypothetical protein